MPYYREFFSSPVIRFVVAMSVVGILLTIIWFDGYSAIIALIAGALFYAVAEYFVHRFLLHEFPRLFPTLYKGHAAHHEHPRDLNHLFSPVHYDILIYCVYIPVVWLLVRQPSIVAAAVTGTLLFQLYYQWMHYVSHRPIVPRTAWGKWMKKRHLLHHYKDEHTWYGVSHPVLDYAMGTHKEKGQAGTPMDRQAETKSPRNIED